MTKHDDKDWVKDNCVGATIREKKGLIYAGISSKFILPQNIIDRLDVYYLEECTQKELSTMLVTSASELYWPKMSKNYCILSPACAYNTEYTVVWQNKAKAFYLDEAQTKLCFWVSYRKYRNLAYAIIQPKYTKKSKFRRS